MSEPKSRTTTPTTTKSRTRTVKSRTRTVAVLGLGAMGARMAANLLDAGWPVVVYNRTPERAQPLEKAGAERAPTPRTAAEGADVVISMVTDDEASRAVWTDADDGALHGMREGAIGIESSTLTPAWVETLAEEAAERNIHFLDAPVVGTRPHAEKGQLIYLVGGSHKALDDVRGLLDVLGGQVHHIGGSGAGMTMKLVVNALFGIQAAVFGELLGLCEKSGLGRSATIDLLSAMPVTSPAAKRVAELMDAAAYSPNFPIYLVRKDMEYGAEAANRVGASSPLLDAVAGVYEAAERAGYGDDDISGIAQLFR